MRSIQLSDVHTFTIGLAALVLGGALGRRVRVLEELSIPSSVVGGLLVAVAVWLLRAGAGVEVQFASALTDVLLLIFFTTIGLSAKLSLLKAGGRPLVILCAVTVLMIVVQNVAGILVALVWGAKPFYGLLVGSLSFVGGPGTAAAWGKEAQAAGLHRAPEVAIAAATLAVSVGAVVSGPITGWLIQRRGLHGAAGRSDVAWAEPEAPAAPKSLASIESTVGAALLIMLAVAIGGFLNEWGKSAGIVLPGFLTAMLAGVLITNVADASGRKLDLALVERQGDLALRAFLAMYLMSLKLWTIGALIAPLTVNVLLQVIVAALIGVFVLFPLIGRDYDAAVTVGGFLGFGLSSMAVAMSTMTRVASRFGPSPKAFMLVTLAGSFFVDLANAFIAKAFLTLPLFR
jgi:ESS family glutamate:Na+ symporter